MVRWRSVLAGATLVLVACGGEDVADGSSVAPNPPVAVSDDGVAFRFATGEEAIAVLTADDEYTAEMQPREAGIRGRDAAITQFSAVKPLYAADVLPWTDDEKAALTVAIEELMPRLNTIDQNLPQTVLMVKTGTVVEGGLPHTRSNAIIFAGGGIPSGGNLKALFLHELHHVMTRANTDLHDAYYKLIGFEPCVLKEPAPLRAVRLSNPDAATYFHYAPVDTPGGDGVIPYLFANRPYDGEGTLSNYFGFGLLPVSESNGACTTEARAPSDLLSPDLVPGFADVIGRNTGYIIHPEETLADNFVFWAMGRMSLPNPEIPEAVGAFWTSQ